MLLIAILLNAAVVIFVSICGTSAVESGDYMLAALNYSLAALNLVLFHANLIRIK